MALAAPGRPTKPMHLPPLRHRLLHQFAGVLAELDVRRTEVGDAVGLRRVGVEGEVRDRGSGLVDRVRRGRRIDDRHGDGVDAGGDQVVHHALLHGSVSTLGIAELQFDIRQFGLGGGDTGFGELPEVRRTVHDEGDRRLVLGNGDTGQRDDGRHDGDDRNDIFHE